ncbi:MAG: carboxypeptidase-like regulatory domain-containing protein [Candidatus Gracilibacteria bacterium]
MSLIERFFTATAIILGMSLFIVNPADAQTPSDQTIPVRIITGAVMDQGTSAPLAGAKVSLYTLDQQLAEVQNGSNPQTTGADGGYSFSVYPAVYRLEVEMDGYLKSVLTQTGGQNGSGGYFYVNMPTISANMPMLSSDDAQAQNISGDSVLFVNPDGSISSECTSPPEVTDIFPIPNSKVKNLFPTIQFTVKTGDPTIKGLNRDCLKMFVNGKEVVPVITGTDKEYTVTYKPVDPIGAETKVRIEACDNNKVPNKVVKEIVFYPDTGSLYPSSDVAGKMSRMEELIATGDAKYYILIVISMGVAAIVVRQIFRRKRKS